MTTLNQKQIIRNCILGSKHINEINNQVCNTFQSDDWDLLIKTIDYFLDIALNILELTDPYERDEFINKYFDIVCNTNNEFQDIEKALIYLLLED